MSANHRFALILLVTLTASAAGAGGPEAMHVAAMRSAIDLGGLDTRSAALMLSAQEAGDLEVSALAVPLPDRVSLVIDVAGGSLLEAVDASATELITEIYAYALDAEGALIATLTQAFRLDLGQDRQALAAGGVKFFGSLELPPGEYSLRILTLQRSSGRLGLRILQVSAPSWDHSPVLVPPVRRESARGWILVHAAGEEPAFPLTFDAERWVPSTRRDLDYSASASYLLLGRGLSQGLRGSLLSADREPLMAIGLGDLRPATGGPPGLEALAAKIDAATLEAGEYRLRVSTPEAATGKPLASADSVPLIVRLAGDAREPIAESTGLSARESRGRQARLERFEELREGYRLTLDRLAAGDQATALEPLIDIESSRIGTGATEEQIRLARAQVEIAREIASPDPERLLTAIWIHESLYRRYHQRKRYLLATHSRQVVGHLAEAYLERDRSPRTRQLVATAMTSLGGYLQQTGSLMAAEGAYHDALEHDPDHPAALVGMAAIQESYGQYQAAVDALSRLHRIRPEDLEVRLRLGVNLRRLGKDRKAEDHLIAAVAESSPEWVAAVAAQELASLHAGDKRLDEALSVLEQAVARHPRVQRLRVQLAAMLDRAGRRGESLAVIDRLDPTVGAEINSPRLRYSRANVAAIAAVRRAFTEEASRGLPAQRVGPTPAPAADGGL